MSALENIRWAKRLRNALVMPNDQRKVDSVGELLAVLREGAEGMTVIDAVVACDWLEADTRGRLVNELRNMASDTLHDHADLFQQTKSVLDDPGAYDRADLLELQHDWGETAFHWHIRLLVALTDDEASDLVLPGRFAEFMASHPDHELGMKDGEPDTEAINHLDRVIGELDPALEGFDPGDPSTWNV